MEERENKHTIPTPYEYGLMSQLAYRNNLKKLAKADLKKKSDIEDAKYLHYLQEKEWLCEKLIKVDDYYAHIWVNHRTQQIVIAHRGSRNVTSWVTDLESVVRDQPGQFVKAAILSALNDNIVCTYKRLGYRLSTTGHSLGGFLAQVCVYWANRHDNPDYYPNMSAVVFDSPGVIGFLHRIEPHIESSKIAVNLAHLNVHNFCAVPTLVSTFGTHTGTIWHLSGSEHAKFAFVMDHRLGPILSGLDPVTGLPKDFRQMTDWPQADYSAYQSVTGAMEKMATEALKLPFKFLSFCCHYCTGSTRENWLDQILKEAGDVSDLLKGGDLRPCEEALEKLEKNINFALDRHYSALSCEDSKTRLGLHHFSLEAQEVLADIVSAREHNLDERLNAYFSQFLTEKSLKLLQQFTLKTYSGRREVVLEPGQGNVFEFQRDLILVLEQYKITSIRHLVGQQVDALEEKIKSIEDKHSKEYQELAAKLGELQKLREHPPRGLTVINQSVVAEEKNSVAVFFADEETDDSKWLEEWERVAKTLGEDGCYIYKSAVTKKEGSLAAYIPQNLSKGQAELMLGLSAMFKSKPSPDSTLPPQPNLGNTGNQGGNTQGDTQKKTTGPGQQ